METKMITRISVIREIIEKYQKNADKLFEEYEEKQSAARQRYSSDVFNNEVIGKLWGKYAGKVQGEAKIAVNDILTTFEGLEDHINEWILKPVDSVNIQLLDSIHSFGLKLSIAEMQIIERHISDSYFGRKILSAVAAENGYFIKVPDIDRVLRELDSVKSNAVIAVMAYAGRAPMFPGKTLLEGASYLGTEGAKYGSFQMIFAVEFLKKNGMLDRLERMLEELQTPVQYELAESEKKRIEKIFGERPSPELVKEMFQKEPTLFSKLGFASEKYKKVVEQYVESSYATGSSNDNKIAGK